MKSNLRKRTKSVADTDNSRLKKISGASPKSNMSSKTSNINYSTRYRSESPSSSVSSRNNRKRWYQKNGWIIALLIIFFPAGIYLMLRYANWSKKTKGIICAVIAVLFLIGLTSDNSAPSDSDLIAAAIETEPEDSTEAIPTEIERDSTIETESLTEEIETESSAENTEMESLAENFETETPAETIEEIEKAITESSEEATTVEEQNTQTIPEATAAGDNKESNEPAKMSEATIDENAPAPSTSDSAIPESADIIPANSESIYNNTSDTATSISPLSEAETADSNAVNESVQQPVGEMVWLSATGSKYHRINNCGNMNPDKARLVTLEEALAAGMEKCTKCY